MTISADAIVETFQEVGLRNTEPRRRIANWLSSASVTGRDFSAEELWHELLKDSKAPGRATVFRVLDTLERAEVVDRIEGANGMRRYRVCGNGAHHHHIVCVECGKVADVSTCLTVDDLASIESETSFRIERHSLELLGRCSQCR